MWMIYSTNNIREDSSSAYIRRCNNTINMLNNKNEVHREPCYIDYKVTETQLQVGQNIDIPNGRIEVVCQVNDYTNLLKINSRFILNNKAYKIRQFIDYNNTETFNDASNYLMKFYADWDTTDYNDNLDDNLADDTRPDNGIKDEIIIPLNEKKIFEIGKKCYEIFVDKNVKVPDDCYIIKTTEHSFTITNLCQNKNPLIVKYVSDDGLDTGIYNIYLGGIV